MNKSVIKKLFKYLNKNIISLSITLVLAIVSVVLTIYVPILFGNAIDFIISEGNVDIPEDVHKLNLSKMQKYLETLK